MKASRAAVSSVVLCRAMVWFGRVRCNDATAGCDPTNPCTPTYIHTPPSTQWRACSYRWAGPGCRGPPPRRPPPWPASPCPLHMQAGIWGRVGWIAWLVVSVAVAFWVVHRDGPIDGPRVRAYPCTYIYTYTRTCRTHRGCRQSRSRRPPCRGRRRSRWPPSCTAAGGGGRK